MVNLFWQRGANRLGPLREYQLLRRLLPLHLRERLVVETQRRWSEPAIARTAPCLLGLFSPVVLLAGRLHGDGRVPAHRAAWYGKAETTFSDCLAVARRHCRRAQYLVHSAPEAESVLVPSKALNHLISCLAQAA